MNCCPVCRSDDGSPTHSESGHLFVRCRECDLVRMDPLPTPDEQTARHGSYLPALERESRRFDLMSREVWSRARRELIRQVGRGRVLNVGCGNGAFLALMASSGWATVGLEVCQEGVLRARSRGVHVIESSVEEAPLEPRSFDAVTAFYVIEHIPRPLEFLSACWHLLRPGGLLYLRFPDTTPLKNWLARLGINNRLYDAPFHVLDFSPRAIRHALERTGYVDVKVRVGGFTVPVAGRDRMLGVPASVLGDVVDLVTGGRVLIRGVSKIANAGRKPA